MLDWVRLIVTKQRGNETLATEFFKVHILLSKLYLTYTVAKFAAVITCIY